MVLGYMPWRKKHGGERNTALLEMKFFDQVLEEAVNRGFIRTNCARKLGIQKIEQEHKNPWTAGTGSEGSKKRQSLHNPESTGPCQAQC